MSWGRKGCLWIWKSYKSWALRQLYCGISLKCLLIEKGEAFPTSKEKWELCPCRAVKYIYWQPKKVAVTAKPDRGRAVWADLCSHERMAPAVPNPWVWWRSSWVPHVVRGRAVFSERQECGAEAWGGSARASFNRARDALEILKQNRAGKKPWKEMTGCVSAFRVLSTRTLWIWLFMWFN